MEPFKHLINAGLVMQTAQRLHAAWPDFDHRRFAALAGDGLEALELKARAMQVCDALEATLPADFAQAAPLLEAAMTGDGALEG